MSFQKQLDIRFITNKSALFIPDIDKWGFVKNRYIGRTFIMPNQEERKKSVRRKLNILDLEFFIVETLKLFKNESFEFKNKIHFIINSRSEKTLTELSKQLDLDIFWQEIQLSL